ncbi:opioid growth factor receptor-related protein [Microvirga arabica]|uniref:Opioid growth factor receptor-related protein n=1 Tax=Microvirga arabica TaxID=1128671 RepID=A0ABV6Y7D2_9HYPH|nr:opioid growth factor receptor-related protein [Microvirga arabica]MBM1173816.1 hypothetical protein [Microvirga arabica]
MAEPAAGPLHDFLAGVGRDSRGRLAADVLGFSDSELEAIHDYIQWMFPLPTPSAAQPHSPVLTQSEIEAIRADPHSVETLKMAAERMLRFYRSTSWWLTSHDHNHLRITRIIRSLKLLVGTAEARAYHTSILDIHEAGGGIVNGCSLQFWHEAASE